VYIHESVQQAMVHLAKTHAGRSTYVTPRHYLDFIKQYAGLFNEKRGQLEEQQKHLNTGLRKLRETQEEVLKMKEALTLKDAELKEKERIANEKLEQILVSQRAEEEKKIAMNKLGEEIAVQSEQIQKRKVTVNQMLASAEPALIAAQEALNTIKKDDLTQIVGYRAPPKLVQLALEPVLLMLHENISNWENMKKVLKKDFIKSVLKYDTNKIDEKLRSKITNDYLNNPEYKYDAINNASGACGPLVKWVMATINFSKIRESVDPLKREEKELEEKLQTIVNKRVCVHNNTKQTQQNKNNTKKK